MRLTQLQNPSEEPNPEQICSILSLLTYSFLDKPIYTAYSSPQLASETLPAIADYDRTAHLVKRSFKHLDIFSGARRQHMFFALMRVFSGSKTLALRTSVLTSGRVGIPCSLVYDGPARLHHTLRAHRNQPPAHVCTVLMSSPTLAHNDGSYLETGGEGALVQPWVWCFLMFLGPVVGTVLMQFYTFTTVCAPCIQRKQPI